MAAHVLWEHVDPVRVRVARPMECKLCERETPSEHVQKHHLFPRSRRKRAPKGTAHMGIKVCCDCHGQIHQFFSVSELCRFYNTIEKLKQCGPLLSFVNWVKKKKQFGVCMARKKRR